MVLKKIVLGTLVVAGTVGIVSTLAVAGAVGIIAAGFGIVCSVSGEGNRGKYDTSTYRPNQQRASQSSPGDSDKPTEQTSHIKKYIIDRFDKALGKYIRRKCVRLFMKNRPKKNSNEKSATRRKSRRSTEEQTGKPKQSWLSKFKLKRLLARNFICFKKNENKLQTKKISIINIQSVDY